MAEGKEKWLTKRIVFLVIGVVFNIIGIFHIIFANKFIAGTYMDKIGNLVWKYVIVIALMATGILTMTQFAMTFPGDLGKKLTIGVTTYSTILTIPLFLTMLLGFATMSGVSIPMVDEINLDIMKLIPYKGWQGVAFFAGTIVGAIFLIEPILACICFVRGMEPTPKNIISLLICKKKAATATTEENIEISATETKLDEQPEKTEE